MPQREDNPPENFVYSGSDDADDVAWHSGNSNNSAHPVGQKKPNYLDIYDMSGNVWEWCWDWSSIYPNYTVDNPKGPDDGTERILRGGSWDDPAWQTRTTYRIPAGPSEGNRTWGFRLARNVEAAAN